MEKREPFIWAQSDEKIARAGCGCSIEFIDIDPAFYQCALHASAGELFNALNAILDDLKKNKKKVPAIPAICELWANGQMAIFKASGGQK